MVPVLVPIINRIGNSRFGSWTHPKKHTHTHTHTQPQFWFQFWERVQLNFYYSGLELVINCWLITRSSPCYWLEWPNPHDCTSSIWDELVGVHPRYWSSRSQKGWVKKVFCPPSNSFFFPPCITPAHPSTPFTQLPRSFCTGKTYISS